jgi:lambda repressor-like predicted transcriptional regulator
MGITSHFIGISLIHPGLIKARLRMEFGSVEAFERQKGLARHSVRDVLRGRAVRRTAQAIADAMGMSISDLFPGRFISTDHKSLKRDSHRLNAESA